MIKPITEKRLYNITLFYLSKYDSSREKVRQMLLRRIEKERQQGNAIPDTAYDMIDSVINKMCSLGYIDDNRFAENQVRILSRQGKSATAIIQKLNQAGIETSTIQSFLHEQKETDSHRAFLWLKRRSKGGFRLKKPTNEEEKKLLYQKDLASLSRNGFSYTDAQQALRKSYENTSDD
ncbi:MAG: RecX family transcriptional regulator [Alphaproteobacteria bacterium]|nr:RecX family transcriptional regulator [Alphaproteobacteria bacterium]